MQYSNFSLNATEIGPNDTFILKTDNIETQITDQEADFSMEIKAHIRSIQGNICQLGIKGTFFAVFSHNPACSLINRISDIKIANSSKK